MDISEFKKLWDSYVDETISISDCQKLMSFISSGEYDLFMKECIEKASINDLKDLSSFPNKDRIWSSVNLQITNGVKKTRKTKMKWMVAASIVILSGIVGYLNYYSKQNKKETYTERILWATGTPKKKMQSMKVFIGPQNLLLPDGSQIVLQSKSSLQIDSVNFLKGQYRDVFLEGEALFNVVHREDIPLVVHSGSLNTTVLGTSFNISAFNTETIDITVLTGAVSVNDNGRHLSILSSNKKIIFDRRTSNSIVSEVDATKEADWANGFLIFQDISLVDAITLINKRFSIDIKFPSEYKDLKVNAKFIHGEKMEDIIDMLSTITGAEFKYQTIR